MSEIETEALKMFLKFIPGVGVPLTATTVSVVVATMLAITALSSAIGRATIPVVSTTLVETAGSTLLTEIAGSS